MTGVEISTAVTVLSQLLAEAYKLNQIIESARAEKRNITEEEWASLDRDQRSAHEELLSSIEKRDSESSA
jgi:hypothetical protein